MEDLGEFTSASAAQTLDYGRRLASRLTAGDVVALQGDLGSGKTHLVKGMAQALGIDKQTVHSPTFSLIHKYEGDLPLYHFDCYRLESTREALEIGTEEYLYGSGISVIEWPKRIASILPEKTIWIMLTCSGPNKREFRIKKRGSIK